VRIFIGRRLITGQWQTFLGNVNKWQQYIVHLLTVNSIISYRSETNIWWKWTRTF